MEYKTKIKKTQITMVVMTGVALIMEIVSLINNCWISEVAGRVSQFFNWGFHKIFNGVETHISPEEVYLSVVNNEGFRSKNPTLTLEMLILFAFIVVVACPLGILLEKTAEKHFTHFVGLNRGLFALSAISWSILPILLMQFFPASAPIVLGFTHTGTVVALHIWFYLTLALYIAMIDIYCITAREIEYEAENYMITGLWKRCGYVWSIVGKATAVLVFFGLILVYYIIKYSVRSL